jgi:hypothetical protein
LNLGLADLNRETTQKTIFLMLIVSMSILGVLSEIIFSGFFTINLSSEIKNILGRNPSTVEAFQYLINFCWHSLIPIIVIDAWLDYSTALHERNRFSYRQAVRLTLISNLIGKMITLAWIGPRLLPIAGGFTIAFITAFYSLGRVKPIEQGLSWLFGARSMGKWCRAIHTLMGSLFLLMFIFPYFWTIAIQFINQDLKATELGNISFFMSFYVTTMVIVCRLISMEKIRG